jgi:tRNA-dihydrouridine synthase B
MHGFNVRDIAIDPPVVLAPMEGVTDRAFRTLIRSLGGCGLAVTEFVSSEAMTRDVRDAWRMAELDPGEHPVSIQIYGRDPDRMAQAAKFCESLGADIVDINFGCPSKRVTSGCAGSALMREPELARDIMVAVRQAVTIPTSVKMRLGWDHTNYTAPLIAATAEELGYSLVTVHGRTKCDGYRVAAKWEPVRRVRDAISIPLLVNGDITDATTARRALEQSGANGVMIGRAVMSDPWTLARISAELRGTPFVEPTVVDRQRVLHAYLDRLAVQEADGDRSAVHKVRKVMGYFTKGLRNAAHLRSNINTVYGMDDARRLFDDFFAELASERAIGAE